jgi:hypothetical protein
MINSIEYGFVKTNTPPMDRIINTATLVGDNHELSDDIRIIIQRAFAMFLADSIPVI